MRYRVVNLKGETVKVKDNLTPNEQANLSLVIDTKVSNANKGTLEPLSDPFEVLKGGAHGVYLLRFNPVYLKAAEANLSADILKAHVFPPRGVSSAGFVLELGEPNGKEMHGDEAEEVAVADYGDEGGQPEKRAKVE